MTNEKQGMPKCTKDKELWGPEKRLRGRATQDFRQLGLQRCEYVAEMNANFAEIPRNGTAASTKNREQITLDHH